MTYDEALKNARGIQAALKSAGVADGTFADLDDRKQNDRNRAWWSPYRSCDLKAWSLDDSYRGLGVCATNSGAKITTGDSEVRHVVWPTKKDGTLDYAAIADRLVEKRSEVERKAAARKKHWAKVGSADYRLRALIEAKAALFPAGVLSHDPTLCRISIALSEGAFLALCDRLAPMPAEAPK